MADVKHRWKTLTAALSVAALIPFAGFSIAQKSPPRSSVDAKELSLAKDYVFAACLMHRYPNSEIAKEADAWASGLVENGHIAFDAYSKLANVARTRTPAPLSSATGVSLYFQSCLALYNNPELPRLIRQILIKS